jgi:hypothetical protein
MVHKADYLAMVSSIRPSIGLKYLMSNCAVLINVKYSLIPDRAKIIGYAWQIRYLALIGCSKELNEATQNLDQLLKKANQFFTEPLRNALVKYI